MISMNHVGIGIVAFSIAVSMLNTQGKRAFVSSLDENQKHVYRNIARNRLLAYMVSYAVASVVGYFVYRSMSPAENPWKALYTATGVVAVVTYALYKFWPARKNWMLNHLHQKPIQYGDRLTNQVELWIEMYKTTAANYHAGFVLALLGFAVMTKSTCPSIPVDKTN